MSDPNASYFRNYIIRPANGTELNQRCPARGCGKPVAFICSFDYRRPAEDRWRPVNKTRCHDHAAAFAAKHGMTLPRGNENGESAKRTEGPEVSQEPVR